MYTLQGKRSDALGQAPAMVMASGLGPPKVGQRRCAALAYESSGFPGCDCGLANEHREAAARVAGLAAYLISLGTDFFPGLDVSTPGGVKDSIVRLSWPRNKSKFLSHLNCIYNGIAVADIGGSRPVRYPYTLSPVLIFI